MPRTDQNGGQFDPSNHLAEKPHRVLFLTSSAPRFDGDSTAPFILNMARDLVKLGWQIEILAPHAHGLKTTETLDGIVIRRFRYLWPTRLQTLCYNGGVAVNLKLNRWRMIAVLPFVVAEFLSAMTRIARYRPSIIHSHWIIPQGVVGQVLSLLSIPHVISVHGTDIYGFQHRALAATKAWALRHCAHVVTNSSATRRAVETLCRPRRISVIPTGTAPMTACEAPTLSRTSFADPRTQIILFVGRLVEAKGVRYLLDALPKILPQQRVKLLIVGDGPQRSALEQRAMDLGVQDDCIFIGAVPHRKVYDYFSIADVFVGPSIEIKGESTEAQGNTFVESLFARVPVVATRIGGITDAVIDQETGLLVDERSPEQIARCVLRVLSEPALAARLRLQGHAHATLHFSRANSAEKIDSIYRQSLQMTP